MPAAAAWTGRAEAQVGPMEAPSHGHVRTRRSGASPGRPWSRPRPTATTSASARSDSRLDSDPPRKEFAKTDSVPRRKFAAPPSLWSSEEFVPEKCQSGLVRRGARRDTIARHSGSRAGDDRHAGPVTDSHHELPAPD